MLPLTKTTGSTWHIWASLGLRWWHHMNVRILHGHCKAAEVTGSWKTVLIPRIQLCPSDPISNQNRDSYDNQQDSVADAWTCWNKSNTVCFFSHPTLVVFVRGFSFTNVTVANIAGQQQRTENYRVTASDTIYWEVLQSF